MLDELKPGGMYTMKNSADAKLVATYSLLNYGSFIISNMKN